MWTHAGAVVRKARDAVEAGLIDEDTLVWSNSLDEGSDWVPYREVRTIALCSSRPDYTPRNGDTIIV